MPRARTEPATLLRLSQTLEAVVTQRGTTTLIRNAQRVFHLADREALALADFLNAQHSGGARDEQ